jgi:protein-S-isoprenylcysteine O-methyltransferase Ste14
VTPEDALFRLVLIAGAALLLPVMVYHRVRSQMTGERLDRRQEGWFMLLTLRPVGLAHMAGLITYMINPARMAWASMPLPIGLRWMGVAIGAAAGALLVWTLVNLGRNLTDTVVTRRAHTLVTNGPYRWIRHPFYAAVALSVTANGLTAANWFLLATGWLTIALMVVRTRKEEALLVARFGDAYRSYMERTGRFLPRSQPVR